MRLGSLPSLLFLALAGLAYAEPPIREAPPEDYYEGLRREVTYQKESRVGYPEVYWPTRRSLVLSDCARINMRNNKTVDQVIRYTPNKVDRYSEPPAFSILRLLHKVDPNKMIHLDEGRCIACTSGNWCLIVGQLRSHYKVSHTFFIWELQDMILHGIWRGCKYGQPVQCRSMVIC
jgi:hypothetical protein